MGRSETAVASIQAWACEVPLPRPLSFGAFTVAKREYTAVRVTTRGGLAADCLALSRRAPVDAAVLDVVGPLLLGREALDVVARREDVRRGLRAHDRDGVVGRAWSMLEICLWGLRSQAAATPLWRLLGGHPREVPVLLVEGYPLEDETDGAFAERLAARAAEGYTALKIEAASYADPARVAARLERLRALCGDAVEIVVDMAWSWRTAREGLRAASAWQRHGLAWIEDPLPRDRPAETAALRRRLDAPIAAGDESTRPGELADLLDAGAVDVLRLDATAVGGLAAVAGLAARAADAGAAVSAHVHPEIHQHCVFGLAGFDHIEAFPTDRPFDHSHELLQECFLDHAVRGRARPPTLPGNGFALDARAVARTAYRAGEVRADR